MVVGFRPHGVALRGQSAQQLPADGRASFDKRGILLEVIGRPKPAVMVPHVHDLARLAREVGADAVPHGGAPQDGRSDGQPELDRPFRIRPVFPLPQFGRPAPVTARHQPQVATVGSGHVVEHVEDLDLHERKASIERRRQEQVVARQVGMPADVAVPRLMVFALADARNAVLQVLGIGRPVVQVRGADLDVPADRVHHQGQHARVVDEVQKRLVMRQGVAHGKGIVGAQVLLRPYPGANLVDGLEQPVEFGRVEELLELTTVIAWFWAATWPGG